MKEILEIFHNLLEEEIEGYDGELVKDYISEDNIFIIETNIDFFKDIPLSRLKGVFEKLLELIYYYSNEKFNKSQKDFEKKYKEFTSLYKNNRNPTVKEIDKVAIQSTEKPIRKILKDLKIMKQYRDMIINMYGIRHKTKDTYLFFNMPKEISVVYEQNEKMIKDIEDKEFKIISKYKYYDGFTPSKTKIRDFLEEIKNKYNLRNISLIQKQLIDTIK